MPSAPEGRVVIITGASAGIGRALALQAARAGFRVVLVARRADRLEALAAEIRASGGACATVAADVRAPDAPARIVDSAMHAFGRIDVVVNNAGFGSFGALLEVSDAAIDEQWQLHVAAPLRLSRAALPHLRATKGQILFVGSGVARVPIPNLGAYAAAKAAIRTVSIQLRRELHADGIAVTYVDPGKVATEFHQAIGIESDNDSVPAAPPERVARAILRGIQRRSVSVSGTLWQTIGTVIGEWSSTLADPTLIKMAPKRASAASEGVVENATVGVTQSETPRIAEEKNGVVPSEATTPTVILSAASVASVVEGQAPPQDALAQALEPISRRMERVKLSQDFIRSLLVEGATLELNEVAMRWAGMPNKNERAALREVFDALAAAGFLKPAGDDTWLVL